MSAEDVPGAWLVYCYDDGPYAISLHATAEEASRAAARQGYGTVGWWPFGTEMATAVKDWEASA